jgi:predicted SprT family Zn-dependent metalloprotease
MTNGKALDNTIALSLSRWGRAWSIPGFEGGITVRFSNRLKRSLGICRPQIGAITLNDQLLREWSSVLEPVLCHEAAHVAAFLLWGRLVRPHGPEWTSLVRTAGFEPAIHVRLSELPPASRTAINAKVSVRHLNVRVVHRCPTCHFTRIAKKRVPGWRCANCIAIGLSGEFVTERVKRSRDGDLNAGE